MKFLALFSISLMLSMCHSNQPSPSTSTYSRDDTNMAIMSDTTLHEAVFASGCFWCVEAIFESVEGVDEAISGYAGGVGNTATYDQVSSGRTDHAEAVKVYYDPNIIDYHTLLTVFFGSHDPTTLNRQGPDRGTQYRSAIFYKDEIEKNSAQAFIDSLENHKIYKNDITTTLEPLHIFYEAEDYHQNYERNNPNNPYVRSVSIPRLKRFQSKFPDLLKSNVKH